MGKDVIIACDFADGKTCLEFLGKFTEEKPFVKIGMELFYAEGPAIVRALKSRGHKVFLDLIVDGGDTIALPLVSDPSASAKSIPKIKQKSKGCVELYFESFVP